MHVECTHKIMCQNQKFKRKMHNILWIKAIFRLAGATLHENGLQTVFFGSTASRNGTNARRFLGEAVPDPGQPLGKKTPVRVGLWPSMRMGTIAVKHQADGCGIGRI